MRSIWLSLASVRCLTHRGVHRRGTNELLDGLAKAIVNPEALVEIESTSTGQIDKNFLETKLTVSVSRRNAIRRRSLAGLVIAQRITRSIRSEEGIVDSECRLHAFGSCCND